MSHNAVPVIDAETEQFHEDLLQSIREFKVGNFARITKIEIEVSGNAVTVEFIGRRLMKAEK